MMRKKMNLILWMLLVIVTLILVLSLSACKNHENNAAQSNTGHANESSVNTSSGEQKSLYAQGLEIVHLMSEMTQSEAYAATYTDNDGIKTIIQNISTGDYQTPKAVYKIAVSEENFAAMTDLYDLSNISERLKPILQQKMLTALMTQVNSMGGVENLAAVSVCTAQKTFVNETADTNVIYLYTFENAVPVAVTFIIGENHAVSANGTFVIYENFTCDSADEVKAFFDDRLFFGGTSVNVTEISAEQ